MHTQALENFAYFLDKSVDEKIAKMVETFLWHMNRRLDSGSQIYLCSSVSKIHWLKTGAALGVMNPEFLDTNLAELPEGTPILVFWGSTWVADSVRYFSEGSDSGTRYDDVLLIDARFLEEACKTDYPNWYHLDYHDISCVDGRFEEIGLPQEGYRTYISLVLSDLDYSYDGDVDVEGYKQAHPIIREYIAQQLSEHWRKEDGQE